MPARIGSILAMLAFAVCLLVGGFQAGNPFGTTVGRALVAMAGTFVVGWLIGWMIEKMNAEAPSLAAIKKMETKPPVRGR